MQEKNQKSVPAKPKNISLTENGRVASCPTCDTFISEKYSSEICPCGQVLTWNLK